MVLLNGHQAMENPHPAFILSPITYRPLPYILYTKYHKMQITFISILFQQERNPVFLNVDKGNSQQVVPEIYHDEYYHTESRIKLEQSDEPPGDDGAEPDEKKHTQIQYKLLGQALIRPYIRFLHQMIGNQLQRDDDKMGGDIHLHNTDQQAVARIPFLFPLDKFKNIEYG
jgi:hypothetical protein